jgi:hypothetical protein
MPRSVTVTISDLVAHKLELMEMSPTKVCTAMLEWYLTDYDKDIGLLFMMEHTSKQIKLMKEDIAQLDYKKSLLKKLEKELKVMRETYEDSSGKLEAQYLINFLRRRVIAYHYDIKEIQQKQGDVIARIKETNKKFKLQDFINETRLLREQTLL